MESGKLEIATPRPEDRKKIIIDLNVVNKVNRKKLNPIFFVIFMMKDSDLQLSLERSAFEPCDFLIKLWTTELFQNPG